MRCSKRQFQFARKCMVFQLCSRPHGLRALHGCVRLRNLGEAGLRVFSIAPQLVSRFKMPHCGQMWKMQFYVLQPLFKCSLWRQRFEDCRSNLVFGLVELATFACVVCAGLVQPTLELWVSLLIFVSCPCSCVHVLVQVTICMCVDCLTVCILNQVWMRCVLAAQYYKQSAMKTWSTRPHSMFLFFFLPLPLSLPFFHWVVFVAKPRRHDIWLVLRLSRNCKCGDNAARRFHSCELNKNANNFICNLAS